MNLNRKTCLKNALKKKGERWCVNLYFCHFKGKRFFHSTDQNNEGSEMKWKSKVEEEKCMYDVTRITNRYSYHLLDSYTKSGNRLECVTQRLNVWRLKTEKCTLLMNRPRVFVGLQCVTKSVLNTFVDRKIGWF